MYLSDDDVLMPGFGDQWGFERAFANQMNKSANLISGFNWMPASVPYLMWLGASTVVIVFGPNEAYWFDKSGDYFAPRFNIPHNLIYDDVSQAYLYGDPDGVLHIFFQSESVALLVYMSDGEQETIFDYAEPGLMAVTKSYTDPNTSTTTSDRVSYSYFGSTSYVVTATLERQIDTGPWTNIRRCTYSYYDPMSVHGNDGDLELVNQEQWDGSAWQTLGTAYFRYYKPGEPNGFTSGVKFALGAAATARLTDIIQDWDLATDEQVSTVADFYFEFDGLQRVTLERVRGSQCGQAALGQYTYAFFPNTNGSYVDDYNNWQTKTIETRPDGSQQVVYANYAGQTMLFELRSSAAGDARVWRTYYQYNANGKLVLEAKPSAVESFSEASLNLGVVLRSSAGHIRVYEFYTTTGGGAAAGFLREERIKNGSSGTEIKLRTLEYTSVTALFTYQLLAKETVYRDDAGADPVATEYAYEFFTDSWQVKQITMTLPAVTSGQNGSGTAATTIEVFDTRGYPSWSMDPRGVITRFVYDIPTGAIVQRIDDFNTTAHPGEAPSGWATPSGFGLHLVTDFEYDSLGRMTQELGPPHSVDISGTATQVRTARWTVYFDAQHVVGSAAGYATGSPGSYTFTQVNPIQLTATDNDGRTTATITAFRNVSTWPPAPNEDIPQSNWVRLTTILYGTQCKPISQSVYHLIPPSGFGTEGTNYDLTAFGYDSLGRQNFVRSGGGTITRTVYDVRSLPVQMFVGTNDTGATDGDPTGGGASGNNMVLVEEREYDAGFDQGDSNLTKQTFPVDASTGNDRITYFGYDFRSRRITTDGEIDYFELVTYDNLDRAVVVDRYDTTGAGALLARSETKYDNRGQVYQTIRYSVSSGTAGPSLVDNKWRDAAGNVILDFPAGSKSFTKSTYDGVGRATAQYRAYNFSTPTYSSASTVSSDTVMEQTETTYDEAGNAILTVTRARFHDATGTGPLTSPSGSQPKARVSYVANYPDTIGRAQATASYGTNGGASFTRSATIPARSDTVLVSSTEYNNRGEAFKTIDPKGTENREEFDDAGRRIKVIQNYKASPSGSDESNTTVFTYSPDNAILTITAKNSTTGDQTTRYVYGTTLSDSAVARSDLRRAEIYPDSDDVTNPLGNGPDTVYDRVEFKYNRRGEVTERKDQMETVREFVYDKLGRQTQDKVTTLGSGVDGAVRRIETAYDSRGLIHEVASYDAASGGSTVNAVRTYYDGYGLPFRVFQATGGAINESTTPKVDYQYASSGNTSRWLSTTYPNGRVLASVYGSSGSMADGLSRPAALSFNASNVVEYSYLGLGTVVKADYVEPDIRYDLAFGGGSDPYDGLDRFGRVVDLLWRDYGSSIDAERIKYGYDRAGNRTYRENTVDPTQFNGELYGYDGMYRLKDFDRGVLNGTKTAITTLKFAQEWSLDATGNWSGFKQDDNGDATWDLNQSRTNNKVNEITNISASAGPTWQTPAYNKAGNMTMIPKPAGLTAGYTGVYDAWNRFVKVADGSTTVAEYAYNGLKWRTIQKSYSGGILAETRHCYYSNDWQVLEERVGTSTTPDRQFTWGLRYVDDLVLRDRSVSGTLDERFYGLQDANWNLTALAVGDVQERFRYDAYGVPTVLTGAFGARSSSSYAWEIRYCGYRWDAATGLMAVRNRYLHSSVGTWITRDILTYTDSMNLLQYIVSNPILGTDYLGLKRALCWPAANSIINDEVKAGAAIGYNTYINKAASTILRAEKCSIPPNADPRCYAAKTNSGFEQPDIVLVPYMAEAGDIAQVFEIKPEYDLNAGGAQLGEYVKLLNACGLWSMSGNCTTPGTSGSWPFNIPGCGYLSWRCKGGVIAYSWRDSNQPINYQGGRVLTTVDMITVGTLVGGPVIGIAGMGIGGLAIGGGGGIAIAGAIGPASGAAAAGFGACMCGR